MLMYAQTFGKVKATAWTLFQCANKEFSTKRHRSRKQTQKHTQHTHAEVVATYLHFSPSVVSEYTHQFAATKTQFCKHSSCAFLSLIRKTEKNETTSTTPKVEKGYDHSLSRGGGGVFKEDIVCITIIFTWFPMRLCTLMIPFHWQLVGTQFCLVPHPPPPPDLLGTDSLPFPLKTMWSPQNPLNPLPLERKSLIHENENEN